MLADDEALLREGLARLLVEAGFEVSGTAQDAPGVLLRRRRAGGRTWPSPTSRCRRATPTRGPRRSEIRRRFPDVGVLVLSHYLESRYAMALIEELPEHSGYLLKDRVSEMAR